MLNQTTTSPADENSGESPPAQPAPSPSPIAPGVELLESYDKWSGLRNKLRELADKTDEWAGIPIPIEGEQLIVSPKYPLAELFNKPDEPEPEGQRTRNRFYSTRYRVMVHTVEENGKVVGYVSPQGNHFDLDTRTMANAVAWGLEQESNALQLLGELVSHHALKTYLLTGMFAETSKRSGLMYIFRKLRPTVAVRADDKGGRVLCCMCLHPLGYYAGSWAGAMCPTDDVIAHLMLMRADEHMFWRSCNQHPPHTPEAGL